MSSTLLKGNPIGGGPILGPSLKFVIKSHLNYSTRAGLESEGEREKVRERGKEREEREKVRERGRK